MLRLMNVIAVVVLIGSAVYAYSIKYSTLYQVEKLTRLKHELRAETDGLAMARAEWAHVAAPVRVEALADQYLGGQVMQLSQIASLSSLPDKGPATDAIGKALTDLGLGATGPLATAGAANGLAKGPTPRAASASSRTGR
jgi:cell division protein FtsL